MSTVVLRSDLRDKILTDVALQFEIHKATGRTIESVKRWARENSEYLLLSTVLNALRSHLKLSKSESLTETIIIETKETV